jgi:hypothetical protein
MNRSMKKEKQYLTRQIRKNMREWKKGRWVSQQQALAVSYSQTRAKFHSKRKKDVRRRSRSCKNKKK